MRSIYDVLLAPVATEKAYGAAGEGNKKTYTFLVNPLANKCDIKRSVEDVFNVKVKKVNVLNRNGKVKMRRGIKGQLSDRRYAMVTLADGSISLEGGF